MNTNPLLSISAAQLKKAAALKERIESLNAELSALLGGYTGNGMLPTGPTSKRGRPPGKGGMSAAGRQRIAEAQKARWAKINAAKGGASAAISTPEAPATSSTPEAPTAEAPAKKRTMIPAAKKRKIAAA